MIDQKDMNRVIESLTFLREATDQQLREFRESATLLRVPQGHDVFVQGQRVESIPLLISGTVRVYQISETGREVTLYRFRPGESCVLTANAIMSEQSFPAIATVEEEAEAVMIPEQDFRDWVGRYQLWREFFINLVSQRLASVMLLVDEVAFQRMDRRVAALLLERAGPANKVQVTHQEIAAELGSSREVISRILEDLKAKDLIRTGRGEIEILDEEELSALAAV